MDAVFSYSEYYYGKCKFSLPINQQVCIWLQQTEILNIENIYKQQNMMVI